MSKRFVCLECGSFKVEGEIPALVDLKINELGERDIVSIDFSFDSDGLVCSECGSCEIAEIGKRRVC